MDVLHETANLSLDVEGDVYLKVALDDVEHDTLHVGRVMPEGWYCQDRNLDFTPLAKADEIDAIEAAFRAHLADSCHLHTEWNTGYYVGLARR